VGELCQRALGNAGAGRLHGREAAGPGAHHRHGHCADLQGPAGRRVGTRGQREG
uniref:Uncharacterized protein n=1 Tax=Chelydra serpentina TaxID=8475 RepID=A0A8C3SPS2_CHESE